MVTMLSHWLVSLKKKCFKEQVPISYKNKNCSQVESKEIFSSSSIKKTDNRFFQTQNILKFETYPKINKKRKQTSGSEESWLVLFQKLLSSSLIVFTWRNSLTAVTTRCIRPMWGLMSTSLSRLASSRLSSCSSPIYQSTLFRPACPIYQG